MKKTISKVFFAIIAVTIVVLLSAILMTSFYRKSFAVNTWINGYYCTGQTIEEINHYLVSHTKLPDITIITLNTQPIVISAQDINLHTDYSAGIRQIMYQRSNYDWTDNLSREYQVTLSPDSYWWDKDKLNEIFNQLDIVVTEEETSDATYVYLDEDKGYQFYDGKYNRLNIAGAMSCISSQLAQGNFTINLVEEGCYSTHEDTDEDVAQRLLWRKLKSYYDFKLYYDMGAEVLAFDSKLLSSFLQKDINRMPALDENGNLIVSEQLVNAWLDQLGEDYNTVNTVKDFQTTEGRVVQVAYNNYGTEIDIEAEKEYLYNAIISKTIEVHKPVYLTEGYNRGKDDIGPTYIEVDMGMQHMYFYQNGELVLDTDVVTGNIRTKCNTPTGINYIEYMQRDRVLVGANYRTPVKYWIRVVGHIGIHDASWRDEYGGDIYLTSGSHGCINTPLEKVSELYEMVEVGIPVVMFY